MKSQLNLFYSINFIGWSWFHCTVSKGEVKEKTKEGNGGGRRKRLFYYCIVEKGYNNSWCFYKMHTDHLTGISEVQEMEGGGVREKVRQASEREEGVGGGGSPTS